MVSSTGFRERVCKKEGTKKVWLSVIELLLHKFYIKLCTRNKTGLFITISFTAWKPANFVKNKDFYWLNITFSWYNKDAITTTFTDTRPSTKTVDVFAIDFHNSTRGSLYGIVVCRNGFIFTAKVSGKAKIALESESQFGVVVGPRNPPNSVVLYRDTNFISQTLLRDGLKSTLKASGT